MSLQLRRGNTAELNSITPAVAEPIWNTQTNTLSIGDGTTAGGLPIATQNGDVVFGIVTATQFQVDGTASSSNGYQFVNEAGLDTGMFSSYQGQVNIYSNGNEMLQIDGTEGTVFFNTSSFVTEVKIGPDDGQGQLKISRVGTNQQTLEATESGIDYLDVNEFRWIRLNPNDAGGTAAVIINEDDPEKSRLRVNKISASGTYTNTLFENSFDGTEGSMASMTGFRAGWYGGSAGYSFKNDTSTGMFGWGAGDLRFKIDGTDSALVDATGWSFQNNISVTNTATVAAATIGLNNNARAFGNGYYPVNANNMKIENLNNGASFNFAMKTGAGVERNVGISRTGNVVLENGVIGNSYPNGIGMSSQDGGPVNLGAGFDAGAGLSPGSFISVNTETGVMITTSVYDYDTDTGVNYDLTLDYDGKTTLPGDLILTTTNTYITVFDQGSSLYSLDIHSNNGIGLNPGSGIVSINGGQGLEVDRIANNDTSTITIAAPIEVQGLVKLKVYTTATLTAVTGTVGQIAIVSNSGGGGGHVNGMLAFWDGTNGRWAYVHDNNAVS
jgi:hypothetical protein